MDSRVFWSVLCACLVASGLFFLALVTYQRYYEPLPSVPGSPSFLPASQSSSVSLPTSVIRRPVLFYAWNEKLPDGYVCGGADGVVYRRRVVAGAVSIEPLYRDGHLVRCGGDRDSSVRYR